jgi:hypothetical protein
MAQNHFGHIEGQGMNASSFLQIISSSFIPVQIHAKGSFLSESSMRLKKNVPNHYPKQKFEKVAYSYGRETKMFYSG